MSQYLGIGEALRSLVASSPALPDDLRDRVALDHLEPKSKSISLQINAGQLIKRFVDASEIWRQPFTLIYRAAGTRKSSEKSRMIEILNGIGEWLKTVNPASLASEVKGLRLGQAGSASIWEQDANVLAYSATYYLDYETL